MSAGLKALSGFLCILMLFISFRLSILVSHAPAGFWANYADHFYYFSIGRLSDHGHYPSMDFYLSARQIWDNSTSLTSCWNCSCLLVPICFGWGRFDVPKILFSLPSLGPCFKRFPRWTLE